MSAIIKVFHDPQGLNRDKPCVVNHGTDLNDWLLNKFGPDGFSLPTVIYLNGIAEAYEIYRTDSAPDVWDLPTRGCVLRDDDIVVIVHSPLGLSVGTIVAIAAISVGTTALGYYAATNAINNIPTPEPPETESMVAPESKNNALTAQTNLARPNGRVPDNYGRNRVYPDLLSRSYHEWVANRMRMTQMVSIGRGHFDLSDWKNADTAMIEGINLDINVVPPDGTQPTNLKNAIPVSDVMGQELFAPNEGLGVGEFPIKVIQEANRVWTFETPENPLLDAFTSADLNAGVFVTGINQPLMQDLSAQVSVNANGSTEWQNVLTVDSTDEFEKSVTVGTFIRVDGMGYQYDGFYRVFEVLADHRYRVTYSTGNTVLWPIYVLGTNVQVTTWHPADTANPSYAPNILEWDFQLYTANVANGIAQLKLKSNIDLVGLDFFGAVEDTLLLSLANSPLSVIGFFAVPKDSTELWFDFQFPQGLMRLDDDGGVMPAKVGIDIIFRDSTGTGAEIKRISKRFSNQVRSTYNYTVKINLTAEGLADSDLTVACYRTSDTDLSDQTLRDEIRWTKLSGVSNLECDGHKGVTWAYINSQASSQSSGTSEINVMAHRKLHTYNEDGEQVPGDRVKTSKFMDAFIHEATDPKLGGKDLSSIDVKAIYAEQLALETIDDKLGMFCYSFSDASVPVMSELQTMATAVRGFLTRKGDIISFVYDREQDHPLALFNRRNKKPNSERKRVSFHKPADFQSVELTYVDEDTNEPLTIGVPSTESNRTSPLRINAAGVKNSVQATNRALYEYYRLLHQRTTVTTTVTGEGMLVELNDRVSNSDGTDATAQDCEVLAWELVDANKVNIITSEPLYFSLFTGYAVLRSLNGDVLYNNGGVSMYHTVAPTPGTTTDANGFTTRITVHNFADTDQEEFAERGSIYQSSLTYKKPYFQKGSILTFYDYAVGSLSLAKKDDYVIKAINPSGDGYMDIEMVNYTDDIFAGDVAIPVIPT